MRRPQASAGVRLRQLCAALVGAAGVYALINMHQGLELKIVFPSKRTLY